MSPASGNENNNENINQFHQQSLYHLLTTEYSYLYPTTTKNYGKTITYFNTLHDIFYYHVTEAIKFAHIRLTTQYEEEFLAERWNLKFLLGTLYINLLVRYKLTNCFQNRLIIIVFILMHSNRIGFCNFHASVIANFVNIIIIIIAFVYIKMNLSSVLVSYILL